MIRVVFFTCFILLFGCSPPPQTPLVTIANNRVWLSDVKWIDKPAGIQGQFGTGSVILFQPVGEFRMAECTFSRWDGIIAVSEGDGFVRYTGTWRVADNALRINYKLNSPTRLVSMPHVTGPPREELLQVTGNANEVRLLKSGVSFRPTQDLSKENLAFLFE